jgi:hypothetical protein
MDTYQLPRYKKSFCIEVQDSNQHEVKCCSNSFNLAATSSAPFLKEEQKKIDMLNNMEKGTLVKQLCMLIHNKKKTNG